VRHDSVFGRKEKSMSGSEKLGMLSALQTIKEELNAAQERVTELIRSRKRSRAGVEEDVTPVVETVRRKLSAVIDGLNDVPLSLNGEVQRQVKRGKKKKRKVFDEDELDEEEGEEEEMEEEEEEGEGGDEEREDEDEGEEVGEEDEGEGEEMESREREPKEREAREQSPKKLRLIEDGMPGRCEDGTLVYFRVLDKAEKKTFKCHANNENGIAGFFRGSVQQLVFEHDLCNQEKTWYLSQLLEDVIWRFKVNFPVLFSCSGKELMSVRASLLKDPSNMTSLIDSLADRIQSEALFTTVSPFLNASNNMALMCAAAMHKKLSERNVAGWRQEFEQEVQRMCSQLDQCDLTFKTLERYRGAGHLMLRSSVLACLLPSFVARLEGPLCVLLDDEDCYKRLNSVFYECTLQKEDEAVEGRGSTSNDDWTNLGRGGEWDLEQNFSELVHGCTGKETEVHEQPQTKVHEQPQTEVQEQPHLPVLRFCRRCKFMTGIQNDFGGGLCCLKCTEPF
jgi:hypothetical protein